MTRSVHSYCRQCLAVCGLILTVEGDQIVAVRGDPEHPVTHGYTCAKGRALGAMHHAPDRLNEPLVRHGDRLIPVSWDEFFADLAARLLRVVEESGPDAVGTYFGSLSGWDPAGRAVAETLHRALGSRSRYTSTTTDCPAKPLVAQAVLGHGAITPLPDLESTALLLLIGTNPVVSHGHTWALPDPVVAIRTVRRRGEVWVVDPRTTETARLASRHLACRAGTDHALLGHLMRELLASGCDRSYLDAYCMGVDELRAAVERFDAPFTADVTGLQPSELAELVAAIRRAGRISVVTGTGATMGANANLTEWFAAALTLVTGSFDRPGGVWCNPGLLARLDESGIGTHKSKPPQPGPPSRPELPRRFGQYPCAAMADEIESGHLRALLSLAGNPAVAFADSARVTAAFRSLEVLAVADIRHTATTDLATHVMPCADPLERADVTSGVELYQPLVAGQYVSAVVRLKAARRPLWWIIGQLGLRLGHDVMPGALDVDDPAVDDDAVLDAVVGAGGVNTLRAVPSGVTAPTRRFGWLLERANRPRFQLAPSELVGELSRAEPPAPLMLIPRRQGRHLNSWFPPAGLRQDDPFLLIHPSDAAEAGLSDGGRARVKSAAGTLVATVSIDGGVARGHVSFPHGFDPPSGPLVSALISSVDVDPLTGMVRQSGVPVNLEPQLEVHAGGA
ncbi:MAG TPA: molybdopterin-dependent oxidoreductase [Acidimicrobiales bacterium]